MKLLTICEGSVEGGCGGFSVGVISGHSAKGRKVRSTNPDYLDLHLLD